MAVERFATDADRQVFVGLLVARGYKPAPPPTGELRALKIGEFRIYDYQRKRQRPQLRVSYWLPVQGPRLKVPKAAAPTEHCTTPGHGEIEAHSRGLCSACYQRWHYWQSAATRKNKRLLARRSSARRANRQRAEARA